LCGDLPKNLSHSRVNPQLAIVQLVDSASEIGADWVITSQNCFGRLCNPVTSKYHSLQLVSSKLSEATESTSPMAWWHYGMIHRSHRTSPSWVPTTSCRLPSTS